MPVILLSPMITGLAYFHHLGTPPCRQRLLLVSLQSIERLLCTIVSLSNTHGSLQDKTILHYSPMYRTLFQSVHIIVLRSLQILPAAHLNMKRPPAFAGRALLLLLNLVRALAGLRQYKFVIPSLTPNALENAPCSPLRGFWDVALIHFFTFFACSSAFFFAKYAWRSA